mmetsp:Transcript_19638/g.41260  ORF Transcript_19638/g.41260 Transcript_19638/m.41260 type:complete len:304 (-) Transcript_19638:91-1002(-)
MRFDPRIFSIPRNLPNPRNIHVPRPHEVREKFQGPNGVVLAAWIISSLLAIIVPVSKWARERNQYYRYYGRYNEYEWKQRQYEEQQNGNNYGNYSGSLCSWWDFRCRQRLNRYRYYQQQNGNNQGGGEGQMMMPSWYSFFGGKVQGDDREREDMGMNRQSSGAMKFVYAWTIVMFIGLFAYGWRNLTTGQGRIGLIVALLIFGQFCILNLITTVQGAIETDAQFFEDSIYGWFGQYSVLLAYTDFWMMLHCFLFAAGLAIERQCKKSKEQEALDAPAEQTEYQADLADDPVLSERSDEYRAYA